jgi:hypothetical protein
MKTNINEVEINGIVYVPKGSEKQSEVIVDGLKLVMVRTYSAGVFFGYLARRESTLAGIEVTLLNARRVYYWAGAATLSQLAMEGTSKPEDCKFPIPVNSIELIAIEIIPITEIAEKSLNKVKIWKI